MVANGQVYRLQRIQGHYSAPCSSTSGSPSDEREGSSGAVQVRRQCVGTDGLCYTSLMLILLSF